MRSEAKAICPVPPPTGVAVGTEVCVGLDGRVGLGVGVGEADDLGAEVSLLLFAPISGVAVTSFEMATEVGELTSVGPDVAVGVLNAGITGPSIARP